MTTVCRTVGRGKVGRQSNLLIGALVNTRTIAVAALVIAVILLLVLLL
ncbi:hypothetical protein [Nocardioides dongkuii]|nr:hypothetical protein [Nocardioides dongkuii]